MNLEESQPSVNPVEDFVMILLTQPGSHPGQCRQRENYIQNTYHKFYDTISNKICYLLHYYHFKWFADILNPQRNT